MKILPLFDNHLYITQNAKNAILPHDKFKSDFTHCLAFLNAYAGNSGTFNTYRRETERLLQWAWHEKKKTLPQLKRVDIEDYIRFCQNPPDKWRGNRKELRYLEQNGSRAPNPAWRPFCDQLEQLSQSALQSIFASIGTLFNFLVSEDYVLTNPVAQIRQKSKFIRKDQQVKPIRRLSQIQWHYVLTGTQSLADSDPIHERTLFMLSILYGLYLRISELTDTAKWSPKMRDFAKDSKGNYWFTTVGKGNKVRQIAVSDSVLRSLVRWRRSLGLSDYPTPTEDTPLLPRLSGHGALSNTASIRRIINTCFDTGYDLLMRAGLNEEAENLKHATVHWLRHTGISEDVKIRPREHVRDDAGHSSSATTDRYIDIELDERHKSAQIKTMGIAL